MKTLYFLICTITCAVFLNNSFGQGPNTSGNAGNGPFWRTGGNFAGNSGNILGNQYNSPIYTICGAGGATNFRMKLNANQIPGSFYNVAGYGIGSGIDRTGYLLLGHMTGYSSSFLEPGGLPFGPFSLLHLNGRNGTFVQTGGYRPWMKTGVTFTDNNDLSYTGIRKVGTGTDITEMSITWADNATAPFPGPDDMCFRFTAGGPSTDGAFATTISATNLTSPADLDGLHIARFTGDGLFGLGNTFGSNGVGDPNIYVRPQSLHHLSLSDLRSVWTQYTNRATNLGSGTGENANDGFRVGILGQLQAARNGNALLYNQENRHILFSTGKNTNNVNTNNTQERVRITRIGAPTNNQNGYGVWNPAVLPLDRTRMSISHDPANPVTRPMSLLHLGYNTGSILNQFSTDGWRNWMDVGTFIAQNSDNMYIGLKNEGNDRYDAVISWGDNPTPVLGIGPDYLRIIFTSTQTPPFGSGPGQANDGLEMARYDPTQDANNNPNNPNNAGFGKMGVGDFTNNQVTHKIHVRGNGRFEYVPEEETDYVLMAFQEDANNPDDISLRRVHIDSLPTAVIDTAFVICDSADFVIVQNGDSLIVDMSCLIDTTSNAGGGIVPCSDLSGAGNLTEDSYVNLNNFDLYFEDGADSLLQNSNNRIGLGYDCGEEFPGKLSIDNKSEQNGIFVMTDGITNLGLYPQYQMAGITNIVQNSTVNPPNGELLPVYYGLAENNFPNNLGIWLQCRNGDYNVGEIIECGQIFNPGVQSMGIRVAAVEGSIINTGGSFSANSTQGVGTCEGIVTEGSGADVNYGLRAGAYGGSTNYAIYADVSGVQPNDYAAYFDGDTYFTGGQFGPSDQNMKTNVNDFDSSLFVINQLQPKTFEFTDANFQGMNLPSGHQYGLIAQDVELVLPTLVSDMVHPAEIDSIGNIINPAYTFKGLDYEAFIPILIGGVQEQQEIIETQDSVINDLENTVNEQDSLINDLNERLTNLEDCLTNILPILCMINQQMVQQNDIETQNQLRDVINVELTDDNNIVLEQNVPNPFAEQTIIAYSIPETVKKAQIHFYNASGKLIQTVDITERGMGQLNVYGSDLSTGVYTYTLVADGIVVATKKMQKMNY